MVVLHDDGLTTLGTLLSPKKPRVKHREQKPRSRRQQMEYRWLERWNELLSWTVIFDCESSPISKDKQSQAKTSIEKYTI